MTPSVRFKVFMDRMHDPDARPKFEWAGQAHTNIPALTRTADSPKAQGVAAELDDMQHSSDCEGVTRSPKALGVSSEH